MAPQKNFAKIANEGANRRVGDLSFRAFVACRIGYHRNNGRRIDVGDTNTNRPCVRCDAREIHQRRRFVFRQRCCAGALMCLSDDVPGFQTYELYIHIVVHGEQVGSFITQRDLAEKRTVENAVSARGVGYPEFHSPLARYVVIRHTQSSCIIFAVALPNGPVQFSPRGRKPFELLSGVSAIQLAKRVIFSALRAALAASSPVAL